MSNIQYVRRSTSERFCFTFVDCTEIETCYAVGMYFIGTGLKRWRSGFMPDCYDEYQLLEGWPGNSPNSKVNAKYHLTLNEKIAELKSTSRRDLIEKINIWVEVYHTKLMHNST